MSGDMHFPLVLCLLATCVTLGLSLSCETCHAFKNTCNGTWQNCPPGQDSCGFIQMEGSGILQVKGIVKTCVESSDCALPAYSLNLGRVGQMLSRTTCCKGKECQKIPPALPPLNTTPNGKRCPACYVVHSHACKEEEIECAGDENYCVEVFGTADLGGATADVVMKGCVSSASCNKTAEGRAFGAIKFVSRTSCRPAAGAASSISASFGFLLQAFLGLLLLTVLG